MEFTLPTVHDIAVEIGGHHFPENWDEMQPEIAGFLARSGGATNA